jgi:anti-anti-sigma factor
MSDIHIERQVGANIVHVGGDLEMDDAPELESAINRAASDGKRVIVSLVDCGYCGSGSLSVFLFAKRTLGNRLAIVLPGFGTMRRIFEIAGIVNVLAPYPTLEKALEATES